MAELSCVQAEIHNSCRRNPSFCWCKPCVAQSLSHFAWLNHESVHGSQVYLTILYQHQNHCTAPQAP